MGRVRSLFKRAAKPFVMVMVAMSLAVSLVVTTPSNAQAATVVAARLAIPPVLLGSGAMPIGAALRLVAPFAGPLGWTFLGITTVAAGLAATQDYWLPYVSGEWGKNDDDKLTSPAPTGTGAHIDQRITSHNLSWNKNAQGVIIGVWADLRIDNTGLTSGNYLYDVVYRKWCQRPDGAVYRENLSNGADQAKSLSTSYSWNSYLSPRFDLGPCAVAADKLVGVKIGYARADNDLWKSDGQKAPKNILFLGRTGQPKPSFDVASPETKYKTTVECIRADGTKFELSAESTGDMKAVKVPSCAAAVPGSHATGKTLVEGFPPGVTVPEKLYDSPAIGSDPDYPLCGVNRPGPLCKLAVKIDGKECVVGDWDCVNWSELSKDANHAPRVSCQYGPYTVPVEKCNPLERAYEEGGAPANEPNTDGNPATRSDTDPSGQQIPKTSPSNGTTPGTSTGPVPGGAGQPQPTETNKTECWPNGWGMFDPSWFLDAMKCAFEPTPNVDAKISNMNQSFSNKAPFVWVAGAGAVVAGSANVSGSCPDWTINVAGLSENVVCESSFTQAILSSRGALFGLMVIGMFWPLIRSIWYSVIPILRPAPIG